MTNYPKHKPAPLDMRRPGAREDLYGPGHWEGSRNVGWEGIKAAQNRRDKRAETVESLLDKVRTRFNITGEHSEIIEHIEHIEQFNAEKTHREDTADDRHEPN